MTAKKLTHYLPILFGALVYAAGFRFFMYPNAIAAGISRLMDTAIFVAYAAVLGRYENAMYALIAMFMVTKVIDLVLYGIGNSSLCCIISEKSRELTQEIIEGPLRRGVTILHGEGAYSRRQKDVILCVIKRTQIAELRRLVKSLDENAFLIMSDVKNVFGKGFESISEIR